jgi:hypothetical protein
MKLFVFVVSRVFVTVSHFHPNLIFAGKAGAYPSGVLMRLHSEMCSCLIHKCQTRLKVTDSDKHPSLLHYRITCDRKKFYYTHQGIFPVLTREY